MHVIEIKYPQISDFYNEIDIELDRSGMNINARTSGVILHTFQTKLPPGTISAFKIARGTAEHSSETTNKWNRKSDIQDDGSVIVTYEFVSHVSQH